MNKSLENYLSIFKVSSIFALSIFFYVIAISVFTFFHFHLSHDMFTINSWITENKWLILFLIKFFVWGSIIYWRSMTQSVKDLLKRFKVFFLLSYDSFFSSLLNIFGIIFFIYIEGVNIFNFNLMVFFLLAFFFISDVLIFMLFDWKEMGTKLILLMTFVLSGFNSIYLHMVEIFELSFLICYIISFSSGMLVVFSRRVHKSIICSIGIFGISLFAALTYSEGSSNRYLVELGASKLNSVILFIALLVANYFLISLRSNRLRKMNAVIS